MVLSLFFLFSFYSVLSLHGRGIWYGGALGHILHGELCDTIILCS